MSRQGESFKVPTVSLKSFFDKLTRIKNSHHAFYSIHRESFEKMKKEANSDSDFVTFTSDTFKASTKHDENVPIPADLYLELFEGICDPEKAISKLKECYCFYSEADADKPFSHERGRMIAFQYRRYDIYKASFSSNESTEIFIIGFFDIHRLKELYKEKIDNNSIPETYTLVTRDRGGVEIENTGFTSNDILLKPLQHESSRISSNSSSSANYRKQSVQNPTCPGIRGFSNIGNTCFFNSGLQCLVRTPPLVSFFGKFKSSSDEDFSKIINTKNKLGSGGNVARCFCDVLLKMWDKNSSDTYINPSNLKCSLDNIYTSYSNYYQEDSHEFILRLLDKLHEDLRQPREEAPSDESSGDGENNGLSNDAVDDEDAARKTWNQYINGNRSVISDNFTGIFRSECYCQNCKGKSVIFEPYISVSLPLSPPGKIRKDVSVLSLGSSEEATLKSLDIPDESHDKIIMYILGEFGLNENACNSYKLYGWKFSRITTPPSILKDDRLFLVELPSNGKVALVTDSDKPLYAFDSADLKETENKNEWLDFVKDKYFRDKGVNVTRTDSFYSEHPEFSSIFRVDLQHRKDKHKSESLNLNQCFEFFKSQTTLSERDMWFCPRCREFIRAKKKMDIYTVPKILIVTLKRFLTSHDGQVQKDMRLVEYAKEIDLKDHVLFPKSLDNCENISTVYQLYAISNHEGNPYGGHYIAHAAAATENGSEKWYRFNDSSSLEVKGNEFLNNESAYVLFYKRKEPIEN